MIVENDMGYGCPTGTASSSACSSTWNTLDAKQFVANNLYLNCPGTGNSNIPLSSNSLLLNFPNSMVGTTQKWIEDSLYSTF